MILCKRKKTSTLSGKKKAGKFGQLLQIFTVNQEDMSKNYDICKYCTSLVWMWYLYETCCQNHWETQDLFSSLFLVVCDPQLQKLLLINGNGNSIFKLHPLRWVWLGKDAVPTTIWSRAILFAKFLRQISAADTTSVESTLTPSEVRRRFFSLHVCPAIREKKGAGVSSELSWRMIHDSSNLTSFLSMRQYASLVFCFFWAVCSSSTPATARWIVCFPQRYNRERTLIKPGRSNFEMFSMTRSMGIHGLQAKKQIYPT